MWAAFGILWRGGILQWVFRPSFTKTHVPSICGVFLISAFSGGCGWVWETTTQRHNLAHFRLVLHRPHNICNLRRVDGVSPVRRRVPKPRYPLRRAGCNIDALPIVVLLGHVYRMPVTTLSGRHGIILDPNLLSKFCHRWGTGNKLSKQDFMSRLLRTIK